MSITEWLILAVLQGITEFLPISSSAHLILPSQLLGWQDQGLVFDVAVHFGTLLAVLIYFAKDLKQLLQGCNLAVKQRTINQESQLVLAIIVATIPVALVGLIAHSFIELYLRSAWVIAATTIGFAVLLWWSDRYAKAARIEPKLGWRVAFWVGFAQVFALIPGTSRSGVTMTAGLFLGLSRESAARFSFLLAIPVIILATLLQCYKLARSTVSIDLVMLAVATAVAFISALLCIYLFLRWIQKVGFLPFVLYRFLLGAFLIALLLTH